MIGISSKTGKRKKSIIDDEAVYTKGRVFQNDQPVVNMKTAPSSDQAKKWDGWGTSLKPATEFWTLARKPILWTVAKNIMEHGVVGINIDGCRIPLNGDYKSKANGRPSFTGLADNYDPDKANQPDTIGRFPANVIFDEFTGEILDHQSGILTSDAMKKSYEKNNGFSLGKPTGSTKSIHDSNSGGASRFFYCAKASRAERNKGLESFSARQRDIRGNNQGTRVCTSCGLTDNGINIHDACSGFFEYKQCEPVLNHHPTVKPVRLMQYLVRLITPSQGTVLDPFNGSGTTGIACKIEGIGYLGIEKESEYCQISRARIAAWNVEKSIDEQLELF